MWMIDTNDGKPCRRSAHQSGFRVFERNSGGSHARCDCQIWIGSGLWPGRISGKYRSFKEIKNVRGAQHRLNLRVFSRRNQAQAVRCELSKHSDGCRRYWRSGEAQFEDFFFTTCQVRGQIGCRWRVACNILQCLSHAHVGNAAAMQAIFLPCQFNIVGSKQRFP